MTKVDIISGFLGAGKTTLIKKLIKEAFKDEKLVLIENEFGEIGIDSGFLKEGGVEITEMNSGCICCSLVGDFGVALKEVLSKYKPDRIIIEPSGVGKLSDVIKAVKDKEQDAQITLNVRTAVVDAKKCKMYMKNFGEFFNNQIENATTILLSRTQDISEDKLIECTQLIKERNKAATLVTTPWQDLEGKQLLEAMESQNTLEKELLKKEAICSCCGGHHSHTEHHHHHQHHHADEVFTSWGLETPRPFKQEAIKRVLEKLSNTQAYGMILRAKGILQDEKGNWFCFDMVPGEYEIRQEAADYTGRLCVIGTKLDKKGLQQLFEEC
ncbi:cobalamin biosynthesis protein CobW [Sporanaerobium hydrogeniformans]|uniref:Cobalamin biosynthesis protein CobW n=1 Tax=Sporanaerobium hydrogeniformans TaxID=3072179 RepID=A0AC61DAK6_9FIRM|nr:cobalamin biosynthesis protein CobW [Sporanaerobium hydrogeniformans]